MRTLSNVLFDLAMHGADRAALVRPRQERKCDAVCVIMEGKASLSQLGSGLLKIARGLGDGPADFGVADIDANIPLTGLFDLADAAPNGWCWTSFKYGKMDITIAIFCRATVAVAEFCTERGAPCSLDPKKAARGWKIVAP